MDEYCFSPRARRAHFWFISLRLVAHIERRHPLHRLGTDERTGTKGAGCSRGIFERRVPTN